MLNLIIGVIIGNLIAGIFHIHLVYMENKINDGEVKPCGNCRRPATWKMGDINRCDRCVDL